MVKQSYKPLYKQRTRYRGPFKKSTYASRKMEKIPNRPSTGKHTRKVKKKKRILTTKSLNHIIDKLKEQQTPQTQQQNPLTEQQNPRTEQQEQRKTHETNTFYYSIPASVDTSKITFFKSKETREPTTLQTALGEYDISPDDNRDKLKRDLDYFTNKCGIFSIDEIRKYFENNVAIFTRNQMDEITGICLVTFVDKAKLIYIAFICVPTTLVRKGLGSMIIERLKNMADTNEANIELLAINEPKTLKFYVKNGFISENTDITALEDDGEPIEMVYTPRPK
jgi:hypothetical protein